MGTPRAKLTPDDIENTQLTGREKKFVRKLFGGPLKLGDRISNAKTNERAVIVEGIHAKLPNAILALDRFGKPAEKYRAYFLQLNPNRFTGAKFAYDPVRIGLRRVLTPRELIVFNRLEKGPADIAQLQGEILKKTGKECSRGAISNYLIGINGVFAHYGIHAANASVYEYKSIEALSPEVFEITGRTPPKINHLDYLEPKYKQLMLLFHEKKRWNNIEIVKRLGFGIDAADCMPRALNNKLTPLGFPLPIRSGGGKGGVWHEVTKEFVAATGIAPTNELESYFSPVEADIIRQIGNSPGQTLPDIVKAIGRTHDVVKSAYSKIMKKIEKNKLPYIYRLPQRGTVLTNEFAQMFGLPRPNGILGHLVHEREKAALEYVLQGGRVTRDAIAAKYNTTRRAISLGMQGVNNLILKTHYDEAKAAGILGIEKHEIGLLGYNWGGFRYKGRLLLPIHAIKTLEGYSKEEMEIERVKGIISAYARAAQAAEILPNEAGAVTAIARMPGKRGTWSGALRHIEDELKKFENARPGRDPGIIQKRNGLILGAGMLRSLLKGEYVK
ncbi:MAG: hypothetical protein V1835_05105 [Candidatus Micrarchaeota archaeon]